MRPAGNGRHCGACDKVVADFSGMSDQQVQDYFLLHYRESICGRFRKAQLDRIRIQVPSYILHKSIPAWKKFLVIILICFGSNIFSFDVAFGNTFNSGSATEHITYLQDNIKKKATRKKKKRKKYHFVKEDVLSIVPLGTEVYGFIVPTQEPPIYAPNLADPLVYGIDSAGPPSTPVPLNKKKPPEKKNPFSKTEFILPAVLVKRKRKK